VFRRPRESPVISESDETFRHRVTRRPRSHSYSRTAPSPSPSSEHLHRPLRPQDPLDERPRVGSAQLSAAAAAPARTRRPRGRRDGADRGHVRRREAYLAATRPRRAPCGTRLARAALPAANGVVVSAPPPPLGDQAHRRGNPVD
jgi:hypothetical protein